MTNRLPRHAVALSLAAAVMLLSCGSKDKEKGKEEAPAAAEGEAATPVQVAAATTGSIDRVIEADAVLWPIHQSSLMPKISAPVKEFFVNRGDHVKAGQLVATLENRDLVAAERESNANLTQAESAYRNVSQGTVNEDLTKAQSDVASTKQALDAAQKVYDSRLDLLNQGAIARKLVDDAKVALVQAQAASENANRHLQVLQSVSRKEQVTGAQAQVDAASARKQSAQAQLAYSQIVSPINGVVADRSLFAGEMASAGTAMMNIVDVSSVIAKANLPVNDAANIKVGMSATISVDGEDIPGKVTVVSPAVDPNTTTVQVWVQAQNPGERLKPGAGVHLSIKADTISNVTLIPATALLNSDEGGQKVMVVDSKSIAHERPVQVGIRRGDKAQITKGLKEGEQVVTVGGLGLEDKAHVKKDDDKKDDDKKDEK